MAFDLGGAHRHAGAVQPGTWSARGWGNGLDHLAFVIYLPNLLLMQLEPRDGDAQRARCSRSAGSTSRRHDVLLRAFALVHRHHPDCDACGLLLAALLAAALVVAVAKYPGGRAPALREATFSIPRGSVVGLAGPSGAGKNTCIDVLTGLLQPTEGAVVLDHTSLADIDQDTWREHIGYVPQDPYLTEDTIAANVAFGLEIDSSRIAEAIEGACLTAVVADLPRGIETPLGDRGRRVSGGQRQRIAIARALYRRPQLLILDEATSALDAQTEQAVIETIERLKGSVTVLVASHRLSTLAACDRIVELDAGRVVADRPAARRTGDAA